ncbi:Qat anti-phage system associated protein QatB [Cetobacterium sp. SF1]|uniref:Qat anti-phage system associated protein QatB n=1 Tax=Cetobacterium sp. SF1 TaxID=3417654 RepID=UPI003CF8D6D0
MGTSSRYNGPVDRNPLLPEGFDLEEYLPKEDEKTHKEESISLPWKNAKTIMTNYLSGNTDAKSVIKTYIKALGGSTKAGKSASSGKEAIKNLSNFLSNISSLGIKEVLEKNKIEYQNRNIEDVLSDIINILSPIPDSKENSVARSAMINTIEDIYLDICEKNSDITMLDDLTKENYNNIVETFIINYIFERLMNDLSNRSELSKMEPVHIIRLEENLNLYISETVENNLKNKLDFSKTDLINIIEELYIDAYEVLEGAL